MFYTNITLKYITVTREYFSVNYKDVPTSLPKRIEGLKIWLDFGDLDLIFTVTTL